MVIIASEVFEHVPYPVQPAFDNLYRLLEPGGTVLFSVPWRSGGFTVEHFRNLHEWKFIEWHDSKILLNRTETGAWEVTGDLQFYEGTGDTLEKRLFSQASLAAHFQAANLNVRFATESFLDYGFCRLLISSLRCDQVSLVRRGREPNNSCELSKPDEQLSGTQPLLRDRSAYGLV